MLVLGQAAVAAVMAATAWAAGAIVTNWAGRAREPMPWALTMALGFAVIGQALTLAGLAGVLWKPVVLAIAIGIHAAAIATWRRWLAARMALNASILQGARSGHAYHHHAVSGDWRLEDYEAIWPWQTPTFQWTVVPLTVTVVTVVLVTAFFLTLYPPLGFDQTMYHLPFARAFAASGGLPFLPALRYPVFPPLAEVLNAAVLMFAGDVATQAVGWVALVACVGLAYTWAHDLAGGLTRGITGGAYDVADDTAVRVASDDDRDSSRAGGWLAAAAIAGSPIALYLAATGYVEPLLALLGGASLYAADRARISTSVGDRGTTDTRLLIIAGILAGSAASVKYHGLYFVPAAALLLILKPAPKRVTPRELVVYGIAATAAMLPCYGRLVAHTGNPVFPFFPELFGVNPWGLQLLMGPSGAERWLLTLTRLWDVTFRREAIGGLPHFSPAFVLALPAIVLAAWRHRDHRLRALLLIAAGYLIAAPTHAHYLLTIAVLWSALFGASVVTLLRARAGVSIALAAAMLLACGGEAYVVYRLYRLGPPPVMTEARDRLIATQRPLYPAIAWLDRTAGPVTLYAVNAEMMVDYASGTLLGDYNGPASFDRMEARVRAGASVAAALDTINASHLLVPRDAPFWNAEASRDPRLTRVYDDGRAAIYRVKGGADSGSRSVHTTDR